MRQPWEEDIRKFEEADRAAPPPRGAVLFVGSSSIAMWHTLPKDFPATVVINRGFGGSQMSDSLRYADRIIIPYRPRLVVIYAGDNDLAAGKTPAQILADYQALVSAIHRALPRTRIAYISVKPSPCRVQLLPNIRMLNELIKTAASQDRLLACIDVFTPMLDAGGAPRPELFIEDGLHLNAAGYALWAGIVAPFLE